MVLTGHADASWVDDLATQRSSQGYTISLGSGSVSWRSTRSSSVLSSSCEAEIYAGAMAAQELRWLTYLLTDLGKPPRSPAVLYVDNKAMLALCREHRLEHRTKHIALRYFLARELQQRGQLHLAYVASQANTVDIFTKALQPCDHQRFCTMLACFALLCLTDELIRLVREFGGKTELGNAPIDGGARAVTRVPAGTAAAYTRVKEFYLQRGLCNRMALSEELSSLKMKEGEGVATYWARAEDLRSKYLAAGGKEEVEEWMMRVLKGLPPHFEMLKVVLNNQSPSLTKDQLLTSLRSEEMRIGVAPRSDGVATFGVGTKVGSSGRGNGDKGGKHGGSGSRSDTNSGRWGQGKGKAGVLDFPWGSKGMAPRGLCHGCWDERGGRGSNGKAQVADEEEQDDKAEAVVGEAVAAVGEEQPREGWWIDTGASHNFTPYASDFKSKLQPPEVRGVRLGDGRVVKAVGMGEVPVVGAGGQLLRIQKVHLVPEMHTRLLSVPHLTSRDVIVTFKGKKCVLKRGERVLAIGEKERGRDHGLVRMSLPLSRGTQGSALAAGSSSSFSPLTLAHRRLGHTTPTTLQQMARGNSVLGLEIGGGALIAPHVNLANWESRLGSRFPTRRLGHLGLWMRVTHSALPASITPMEAWFGQKPHVGMARIWGCMGSVMLHGHEKGGKLDARAVMCVCVGVDMESKGWRMLDPSLMRIRIARDIDFLENVMWKDWDKAKGFGELLQDAAVISQLLPLPLSPPSATADDVEMPPSSRPLAPLSVSVQQQPTPLQQLSGPSVIQRRSATQATSSSSSSGQRSVPLSTGAPPSPATTSPPPVTGALKIDVEVVVEATTVTVKLMRADSHPLGY
ncbi:unnamed protein product [Closterium sp. NIES-53]